MIDIIVRQSLLNKFKFALPPEIKTKEICIKTVNVIRKKNLLIIVKSKSKKVNLKK